MKVLLPFNVEGNGIFSKSGYNLTSPLILFRDPVDNFEPATKQYVNNSVDIFNADNLITGTLSVERFPSLTGDITSATGSGQITLNTSGIVEGSYTKVTVNTKGICTFGNNIKVSDIPNINWSSITSGKPTTLSGYGITDGLSVTGGTITGYISCSVSPTLSLHAVNKTYADNLISNSTGGLPTGDIIKKFGTTALTGFLRCNGAEVSIADYSALYSVIGDGFTTRYQTTPGSGLPWKYQYGFNSQQSSDITNWTQDADLPYTMCYSQSVVTKNIVYMLGGYINEVLSNKIYKASINADGTLGTWSEYGTTPYTAYHHLCLVIKDKLYMVGGYNNGTHYFDIYYCTIAVDGSLGSWTKHTSNLTVSVVAGFAFITKGRVYFVGTSIYTNTAVINLDGTLNTISEINYFPTGDYKRFIVTKSKVYCFGIYNSTSIYVANINSDGTVGTWSLNSFNLPETLDETQVVTTNSKIYIIGSYTKSKVYISTINSNGVIEPFTLGTSLPAPLSYNNIILTSSRIYLLGGSNINVGRVKTVYYANFSGGRNEYLTLLQDSGTADGYFKLPDYTSKEINNFYYFIKT